MEYLGGGSALDLVSVKEVSSQIYWSNSVTFQKSGPYCLLQTFKMYFKWNGKFVFWDRYSTVLMIRWFSRLCNLFMCWVLSWMKLNRVCFSLWRVSECFISVSSLCVCVCSCGQVRSMKLRLPPCWRRSWRGSTTCTLRRRSTETLKVLLLPQIKDGGPSSSNQKVFFLSPVVLFVVVLWRCLPMC